MMRRFKRNWLILPLCIAVVLLAASVGFNAAKPQTQAAPQAQNSLSVYDLYTATNAERAKAGLPALRLNPQLNETAQAKAKDMTDNNYYAHHSPITQKDGIDTIEAVLGNVYRGEILDGACPDTTAQKILTDYMNSPEHKPIILDPRFTDVGIGFTHNNVTSGTCNGYEVEHFAQL